MKELTKYLKFLFVSSILLFACSTDISTKEEIPVESSYGSLMTREDSIVQLAKELNIDFNKDEDDVHSILDKILIQKKMLISRLDSLGERADQMERMAYEYRKKEDDKIREDLISQINQIKGELNKIKQLAREKEITKKDELIIPEKEVDVNTKTFEDLQPGNYVTRLDSKHLIRIFITQNKEVIVSDPILDSTTVIRSSGNVSPRMAKELEQIRERLKNNKDN